MPKGYWTRWTSALSKAVPQSGTLYDGNSARAHLVTVFAVGSALRIESEDVQETVPAALLRNVSSDNLRVRISRSDVEGWSLTLDAPVDAAIADLLPAKLRYGGWIDRVGLMPALVAGAAITAAVVALGYAAPAVLAPHVPLGVERKLGDAVVGDFGSKRCRNAAGQQALEALAERVSPGSTKGPDGVKIAALDLPVFNAAALPGGYVVIFKPAITDTNPDALAGIVAHEIAHVQRRHVTKALIRELGIGALIRLFAGQVGANAEQLLGLSYTRADEAQADTDAAAMLKRAGISPKPTAELFARLASKEPSLPSAEFLQNHPISSKRAAMFASGFDPHAAYSPALSVSQARALRGLCGPGK